MKEVTRLFKSDFFLYRSIQQFFTTDEYICQWTKSDFCGDVNNLFPTRKVIYQDPL